MTFHPPGNECWPPIFCPSGGLFFQIKEQKKKKEVKQRKKITRQQRIERTRRSKRDENARVTRHRTIQRRKDADLGGGGARASMYSSIRFRQVVASTSFSITRAAKKKKKTSEARPRGAKSARGLMSVYRAMIGSIALYARR